MITPQEIESLRSLAACLLRHRDGIGEARSEFMRILSYAGMTEDPDDATLVRAAFEHSARQFLEALFAKEMTQ